MFEVVGELVAIPLGVALGESCALIVAVPDDV